MKWIDINTDRPAYYGEIIVITQSDKKRVCWMASDGDNDIYTISGTDTVLDEPIKYWSALDKINTNTWQLILHDVMRLLPCPFCNGEAEIIHTCFGDNTTFNYAVQCENGHRLDYWSEDKITVINNWNDRQ